MKWCEIKIKTTTECVDLVSNVLYDFGVNGVVIEDANDLTILNSEVDGWDYCDEDVLNFDHEGAVVKGYLPTGESLPDNIKFIKEQIAKLFCGDETKSEDITTTEVNDEDWANEWKKYYKPTKISNRIVVKPTWEEYHPLGNEEIIELDPGMAFGTGTHETTRMCAQLLERYVEEKSTVYDIGCGSGILSIAAAKLGANKVIAVDMDEVAVKVSKENVKCNHVDDIVEVKHGNLMDVINGKANIIVANIIADVIKILSNDIIKFMKDTSIFISSGIIIEKIDEVADKLKENGLEIISINKDGEWAAIVSKIRMGDINE